MKDTRPAYESPAYKLFIEERDKALESLYLNANFEVNDLLRRAMLRAVQIVGYRYAQVQPDELLTVRGKQNLRAIDDDLAMEFNLTARHIALVIQQLNANAYTLSLVGEAEAIGRALKMPAAYEIQQRTVKELALEDFQGESIEGRVALAFSRLRRDIMDAVELSRVKEENQEETIERVKKVFPRARTVKRPPKKLKKITEADFEPFNEDERDQYERLQDYAAGFIDDEAWRQVVDAYRQEYVPKWRGPETVFDITTEGLTEEWYGWEVEQYMANEFVAKVRQGQEKSAKQNGIVDMVWIAVVDDKTDQCCLWRDGLTSSEIEKALKSGKHKDDECTSIVPPAHFNCRCTMSPLLDVQLAGEEFERPASNAKEFDEWLNS